MAGKRPRGGILLEKKLDGEQSQQCSGKRRGRGFYKTRRWADAAKRDGWGVVTAEGTDTKRRREKPKSKYTTTLRKGVLQ